MPISGDIGAELRTYLLTQSGVTSLVGASTLARIYPGVLPQNYDPAGTGPAILYAKQSTVTSPALGEIKDTERCRIQYDCYASTRTGANALARALQNALESKRSGALTTLNVSEIMIDGGQFETELEPNDGGEAWTYVTSLDIQVWYY